MTCETAKLFPLSYQQKWVCRHQLAGPVRRATCWVEVTGSLDAARLREAIRTAVRAHEILRVSIHPGDGSQEVREESDFVWVQEDLHQAHELLDTERIQRWYDSQADNGDGEYDSPLRVLFASFADDRHLLLISLPATCADAVSMEHLIGFIASCYAGEKPSADDILQYSDYTIWQQEILNAPEAEAGATFWRQYFRTPQPRNSFPLKFACDEHNRLQSVTAELEDPVTQQIERFCSEHRLSPPDLLLACWHVFLQRLTQLRDLPLLLCCQGRSYPEFEDAIGPLSKWLPLRVDIAPEIAFSDFAATIKAGTAAILAWQHAFRGFPEEDKDGSLSLPLSDFGFDFTELGSPQNRGGVQFTLVRAECCSELFALRLSVQKQQRNLDLEFYFDAARVDRRMVEEWSESFLALLKSAMNNPRGAVGSLSVLSPSQSHRITLEWNQTTVVYPRTRCVQELIEEQASVTPERVAVRCLDRTLTYEQLNRQANQVAHWLGAHGAGPDKQVGLCMERSVDLIVGLLGILKSGSAYVPLNPEHPPLRLLQQLHGAIAVVTDQKSRTAVADFHGAVISIDDPDTDWRTQPDTSMPLQTTPESLAYVLFTSGSTGTPKGVAVRHRNLVNYTWFARDLLELESHPEGLQFALVSTVCADVGNTCIYPALTSGGCLHVVPYDVATDSARYAAYSSHERIDVLKIVPSHLEALLTADGGRQVLPRRFLVVGGERLTPDLVAMIESQGVGCRIVNHYAPTETTCGSLTLRLDEFDWNHWIGMSIPLGRPIANTRLYVLDPNRQPLPVGARGELYIGGDGVSAGYVGDPQRTADRFVPDPFVPGSIVYRSGDIVRYLADGNIEFLERVDDQVKIRGFRVELGEIQAALEAHELVHKAVVLARDGHHSERRLLGWAIAKEGAAISGDDLRDYLKQRLPDYMVPAKVMVLANLPLTRNGKVDRQALPEPEAVATRLEPGTSMEETVATVWRDVLGRQQIGMEENFFEIGGHSLLATQIVGRLRNLLEQPIAVRTLFDRPTIAEFARELEGAQLDKPADAVPALRPVPRNGNSLPLSFAQERLWMLDQFEPHNSLYNIPRTWRLRGLLNKIALSRALNEIVRRHESQRTTFATHNGQPVQLISAAFHMPLASYDLSTFPAAEAEEAGRRILEDEAARPFDLQRGPLVRACLVQLSADDHLLLLVSHHIVTDAWSADLLARELTSAYDAFSQGKPSPLPPVPLQYADYAAYERNYLQGNVLAQLVSYWRQELAGVPTVLDLPTDRPRSSARSYRGSCETVKISESVATAVKQLAQAESTTPFAVLMSVFHTLLWSYSGQSRILVGTDVANRERPELENVVGFFVNVLPIKSAFSQNTTFREQLRTMRQTLLGAYAHQQLPFAKIVRELRPERSNRHNPLVQALFVFQNAPRAERTLAELEVAPFPLPLSSSKFDIAVFAAEASDALVTQWVYSTDLFDRDTIVQMNRRFNLLLQNLITDPDVRLESFAPQSRRDKANGDPLSSQATEHERGAQPRPLMPASDNGHSLPLTTMEESLTVIWSEVLERETVGVNDNLFEIGGHSLTATQIASRLRSQLGLEIYVRMIFDYPTIRGLARAIDDSREQLTAEAGDEITRAPRVAAKEESLS